MPTKPQITLNSGLGQDLKAGTLQISCGQGLDGARLSGTLHFTADTPHGRDLLEISAAGMEFRGRIFNRATAPSGRTPFWSIQAIGFQEWLARDFEGTLSGNASAILTDLLDGTPVGAQIIGTDKELSITENQSVANGLLQVAEKGRYKICVRPDGDLVFIDTDGIGSPERTIAYGGDGVQAIKFSYDENLSPSRLLVRGQPTRKGSEPATAIFTATETGNGTQEDFKYPDEASRVIKVYLDDVEQSLVYEGHPDDELVQAVNNESKRWIHFNTAPAADSIVKIEYEIEYVRVIADNTDLQDEYSSRFGGDGKVTKSEDRPDFRTNVEAQEYADEEVLNLTGEAVTATAELFGVPLFLPGDIALCTDSRYSISEVMWVDSGSYKWSVGDDGWKQSLSLSKTKPKPNFLTRTSAANQISRSPHKSGTEPSTGSGEGGAKSFTVSVSPSLRTITNSGCVSYTVTVTPVNGFLGTVSLTANGLPDGVTASFTPATLTFTDADPQESTVELCHAGPITC